MTSKEATEQAMKVGIELEQKIMESRKKEAERNRSCDFPEHEEAMKILHEIKLDLTLSPNVSTQTLMKLWKFFAEYKL